MLNNEKKFSAKMKNQYEKKTRRSQNLQGQLERERKAGEKVKKEVLALVKQLQSTIASSDEEDDSDDDHSMVELPQPRRQTPRPSSRASVRSRSSNNRRSSTRNSRRLLPDDDAGDDDVSKPF